MHTEKSEKTEPPVQNRLRAERVRQGMSQPQLAARSGVTRQTIGAVEAGRYAPTAAAALRLARALNCRVEDLFWLEEDAETIVAERAAGSADVPAAADGERVAVAKVGTRYVAHSLQGDAAFAEELRPADGVTLPGSGAEEVGGRLAVHLLASPERIEKTAVVAGCAPALSLWARSAEDWRPGLRTLALHANSRDALMALRRGDVHVAGLHLYDAKSRECNVPFVREAFAGTDIAVLLLQLGWWEEGFLVPPGNPQGIRSAESLAARPDVRLINREPGSGVRALLDEKMADAGMRPFVVNGYEHVVTSHAAVARTVASGQANVGVSTASLAAIYGLDFVPLRRVRYDLAVRREHLDNEPVRELLATLDHGWVKQQLRISGGFETAGTGEVSAEIG